MILTGTTSTSLSSEDEARLLSAARRGDPDAFMALLAPAQLRLHSLVRRLVRDEDAVGDVLQDTYLAAYRGLPKFRGESLFSTWLYRITYNACLAYLKRVERNDARKVTGDQADAGHAESSVLKLDLARALDDLPVEQRALVLMVDRDGLDYQSAAEVLGIPLGTVSSRLALARGRLRRALASEEREE